MSLKKVSLNILFTMMISAIILTGCGTSNGDDSSETSGKNEEYKLVWYAPAPHPYFEEVIRGVEEFEKEFEIEVEKQIGPDWEQQSQTLNVEALAAKGAEYFSIYPADGSGANGLYEELVNRGASVINFGTSTIEPTEASLYVGTDVKQAAMDATEELIQMMDENGKIINVLEVLEDTNTVLRKEGVEEVVDKYPEVEIIQEISGMQSTEEAIEKVDNAIAANIEEVDGIIATGFTPSLAIAQVMSDYMKNDNAKKIHTIGVDSDPVLMDAIEEGVLDATIVQNSTGHGYLSTLILKKMADGWTPKSGEYFIDGGTVLVTKENMDTFEKDLSKVTKEIKDNLETKYLEKK